MPQQEHVFDLIVILKTKALYEAYCYCGRACLRLLMNWFRDERKLCEKTCQSFSSFRAATTLIWSEWGLSRLGQLKHAKDLKEKKVHCSEAPSQEETFLIRCFYAKELYQGACFIICGVLLVIRLHFRLHHQIDLIWQKLQKENFVETLALGKTLWREFMGPPSAD